MKQSKASHGLDK